MPTGATSGPDPVNVTVVVLHFGSGGSGGGGGGGGGGNSNAHRPGQHARNSSHLCGALARHTRCGEHGPF
jgi:hypothetical protein